MVETPDVRAMVAAGRLTVTVPEAGAILGLGRTRAFEMARSGELPGVRKLGRRYLVALPALCTYLSVEFPALGSEGVTNGNDAHSAGSTEARNDESALGG